MLGMPHESPPALTRHRLDYEDFCLVLSTALSVPVDQVAAAGNVISDLRLDEVSLVRLLLKVQELNPWFRLPDQMDIGDVGLSDVYHYYCTMDRQHVQRDEA